MGKITDFICEAIEGTGEAIAKAIEVGGDAIISGVEVVRENPGKTAAIVAGTVVTGGACLAGAGVIASAAGSAGGLQLQRLAVCGLAGVYVALVWRGISRRTTD